MVSQFRLKHSQFLNSYHQLFMYFNSVNRSVHDIDGDGAGDDGDEEDFDFAMILDDDDEEEDHNDKEKDDDSGSEGDLGAII